MLTESFTSLFTGILRLMADKNGARLQAEAQWTGSTGCMTSYKVKWVEKWMTVYDLAHDWFTVLRCLINNRPMTTRDTNQCWPEIKNRKCRSNFVICVQFLCHVQLSGCIQFIRLITVPPLITKPYKEDNIKLMHQKVKHTKLNKK